MLSPKQYEAIGRLALAFNGIEQMLDMYLPDMLGNPEVSLAFALAERATSTARKIEFLRKVLQAILRDRPPVQPEISAVLALLERAKILSQRRNEYIHAFAFVDYEKRKRMLRTKNQLIECNEQEIMDLANEADDLRMYLSQSLHKLQVLLMKMRSG